MISAKWKRRAIIYVSAVLALALIVSIFARNNNNDATSTPTNTTADGASAVAKYSNGTMISNIANFDSLVKNLSTSEKRSILTQLSIVAGQNISGSGEITDVSIREGSYSQMQIDKDKQIYYTTFIVDIPSAKQSYVVKDYYSPLSPEESGLVDYTVTVSCPTASQLIYGDFSCNGKSIMTGK